MHQCDNVSILCTLMFSDASFVLNARHVSVIFRCVDH
jgi:hypothetical protein